MAVATTELPEEMLIEVFEYQDAKSVKQASLVCKEWNRVIGIAPKIMKKFILRIQKEAFYYSVEELMSLQRHYTSADLCYWNFEESQLMELVERFGGRLVDFKLAYWDWTAQTLLKILRYMPELERLAVKLEERQVDDTPTDPLTLEKLKTLAVYGDWDVFPLIKAPMLMDLKTNGPEPVLSPKIIESFLKASPKLESLRVQDIGVLGKLDSEFPFQLKKFVADFNFPIEMNEKVRKFLHSQAATVETLEARCYDSEFLEIVLTKFKRLRSLKADSSVLDALQEFYKNLEPLPLLKEFKCGGFSSDIAMRAVLGNCPELVKLDLGHDGITDQLDFLAENNKSLESLTIPYIITGSSTKFRNLKSLTLSLVDNAEEVVAFLKANLTIETLDIEWLSESCRDFENLCVLIVETSLKHVKIEGMRWLLEEAYCKMKSIFGTWKTVKLDYASGSLKIEIIRSINAHGTKRKRSSSN